VAWGAFGYRPEKTGARFLLAVLFVVALPEPSQARELECPLGTSAMISRIPEDRIRIEYCRNFNGLRHGPLRYVREADGSIEMTLSYESGELHGPSIHFDQDNEVAIESEYFRGQEVSVKATERGKRMLVETMNADARKRGRNWRVEMRNENVMRYIVEIFPPWSSREPQDGDASLLKEKILSESDVCSLFRLRGFVFDSIEVSYVTNEGQHLTSFSIAKSECESG
jgi:hypothetical protein